MPDIFAIIRRTWKNYVKDQRANPLKFFNPVNLAELRKILNEASANGLKVKAVGSGHSSSDIAVSRDIMINTHGLDKMLDLRMLDLQIPRSDLFFAECGITIGALNRALEERGKALINMGAYDGQTIAGAISTSTHGSGITLGAFPDYMKAFFLLGEDGMLYHIERSKGNGISMGPAQFPADAGPIKFIQDDDHFFSVGVSMGCMGIIYAVVIEVTGKYMLEETRDFVYWSDIKKKLAEGSILNENRHLEVLISPYKYSRNDYKCLLTRRNISEQPYKSPLIPRGHRKVLPEIATRLVPFLIDAIMRFLINKFPKSVPTLIQLEINTLSDRGYVDKSYKVLNLGADNNLAAYATEIALPLQYYLDAVEEIIRIVDKSVEEGKQYLSAAFSLRFVKISPFYLAMQHGGVNDDFVCMIEFPTVSRTISGLEMLARIESALYRFGGTPHWGQINHVGGTGQSSPERLYPDFQRWLRIYREISPEGRFENDFTDRCGISHFKNNSDGYEQTLFSGK
jgi:hypothetical protein